MSDFIAIGAKTPHKVVCSHCGKVIAEGRFTIDVIFEGRRHHLGKFVSCCWGRPKLLMAVFSSTEEAQRVVEFDIKDESKGYDLMPLVADN